MPDRLQRAGGRLLVGEMSALTVGYLVGALRLGLPDSPGDWSLVTAGALLVGVPAWLRSRREAHQALEAAATQEQAARAEATLRAVLGGALTPVANLLGRIGLATTDDRHELEGQLKQLVVDSLVKLTRGERARACFFELQDDAMVPVAWSGRADEPVTVFRRGERRGDAAHRLVHERSAVLVEDVDVDAQALPAGVEPRSGAAYKAFLSVPVRSGDQAFGMLTVDVMRPRSLHDDDVDLALAMGQLLAVGLSGDGRPGAHGRSAHGRSGGLGTVDLTEGGRRGREVQEDAVRRSGSLDRGPTQL